MFKKIHFKAIFDKGFYSLTGKLIITIGSFMLIGSMVFWYVLIKHMERELVQDAVKNGVYFTDYIKKSTRYGMLTFNQESIQQIVETMGYADDVLRIKIFNKKGEIKYASERERVGSHVNVNSPMCKACHHDPARPIETLFTRNKWTITKGGTNGNRTLNIVEPIYNEESCYTSACHIHSKNQKVLGIIRSDLSLALVDQAMKRQGMAITTYVVGFIVLIAFVLGNILWRFVSKPVAALVKGMESVGGGNLDFSIRIDTRDEMSMLAKAFNAMTTDLKSARKIMFDWTKTLEEEVEKKTEEIHKTQGQLIHTAKLASLGRMAAGVAHEINNPLTGIVTFAHLMMKRVPPESEGKKDLEVIIEQADRCSKIIKGLLRFARATAAEKGPTDINEVLNLSIEMLNTKVDFQNIKFEIKTDNTISPVIADSSQLQQVFLNLLVNAADAMEGRGTITVATRKVFKNDKPFAEIEFTDTGPGISKENMAKIFEPFFSTKSVGKGTGLGLAVSHGIIQEHKGEIIVNSEPGHGTSFFVRLPL